MTAEVYCSFYVPYITRCRVQYGKYFPSFSCKSSIYLHCIQLLMVYGSQMTNSLLYNTKKIKKVSRSLSCVFIYFLKFKGEKPQVTFLRLFLFIFYFIKFCDFYIHTNICNTLINNMYIYISARVKPPLKNDFQITKNHLIYRNIRMKQSYQMKSGE